MVLFVLPSVSHMVIVREHRHIQAEVDRFQTRLHFQRVEFDLEPLMFNEALLLTISPVCVEIYMGSSIKDCFFSLQE
jgi:hypothetical protein